MSENNNKSDPKKEDAKPFLKKITSKIVAKLSVFKGEFKKIIWPEKNTLIKHTVNVIITSTIIGAVIMIMDFAFSSGFSLIIGLFQ